MAYSNALYFGSQFDKLTEEVLSTFKIKQKLQKNAKTDISKKEKIEISYSPYNQD
jgi:hypothetical protein